MTSRREWDVFISFAGEDRHAVAVPLAEHLRRAGANVWLDQTELRLGDSLTEKIDEGLSKSRFGVVVLSPDFFRKHWPRRELAGLRSREEFGRKTILPVWHGVDKTLVAEFSPILSDTIAANTAEGIPRVAASIIDEVFSASTYPATDVRRFVQLLEGKPTTADVLTFLQRCGAGPLSRLFDGFVAFGPFTVADLRFDAVSWSWGTGGYFVDLLVLTDIWSSPFEKPDSNVPAISRELAETVQRARSLRRALVNRWALPRYRLEQSLGLNRGSLPHTRSREEKELLNGIEEALNASGVPREHQEQILKAAPLSSLLVLAGRRSHVEYTEARIAVWRAFVGVERGPISIRTYDALIDMLRTDTPRWVKYWNGGG